MQLPANSRPAALHARGRHGFPDDDILDWLAALQFEDIPERVVASTKQALLDTLAVGWAGWAAEGVAPVLDYIQTAGPGASSLWGHEQKLPAPAAALGNGLLAAALDFDIVHDGAIAHTHIVMLPALLAVAEATNTHGRDFMAAYMGGCETAVRLGSGIQANPGWVYSSVLGVIAGAAACARLLGLGRDGVRAAASIAFSRASGSQQSLIEGSFTKRLETAFAARDAVESALLAQCGVTGPRRIFSGPAGFQALYAPLDSRKPLLKLGEDWHFNNGTFKNFPSCFCNHAAIVAAQRAAGRLLATDEIKTCTVRIPPFSARMVGGPFKPGSNPQVSAQFSVRYSVANALLRGGLALDDITATAVLAPDVASLAQRIQVEIDESADGSYTPATVCLTLRDETMKSVRIDAIPGTPALPAAPCDLLTKAEACFKTGIAKLSSRQFARLSQRIDQLEAESKMRDFWQLGA